MKEILLENGFPILFPDAVKGESENCLNLLVKKNSQRERISGMSSQSPLTQCQGLDAVRFHSGNFQMAIMKLVFTSQDVPAILWNPILHFDKEAYERATSVYLPGNPMLRNVYLMNCAL